MEELLSKVGKNASWCLKIPDFHFSGSITLLPLSSESLLIEAEPTGVWHSRDHGAPIHPSPSLLAGLVPLPGAQQGRNSSMSSWHHPLLQGKCWDMVFPGWEWHMERPTCQKTQGMLWGCIPQVSLARTGIWDDPFLHCCTHKSTQLSFTGKNGTYLSLPNAVFNLCPKLQWDIKSDRICCYSLFLVFHQILLLNHSAVAMLRRYCRQVTWPEHSKRLANEEWSWFPIRELKALEGIESEEKKKSWSAWLEFVTGVWLFWLYPPDIQVNHYFILLKKM